MYILIKIGEKIIQTLKKTFQNKIRFPQYKTNMKLDFNLKFCLGKKIKNKSSHS